jgi:glutathione S-transferase
MSDFILHQYADSPFSEKIRALLAYKGIAYTSVEIPAIMPKPDVTALTGGYRRTPVMQCGADIYCDSALIARLIEARKPSPSVFIRREQALMTASARWTDSEFFRVCVGLVFQPAALAANPRFRDPVAAEAFLRDRTAFTAGSPGMTVPLPQAEAAFRQHAAELETQLSEHAFLGGDKPSIADFSTWHCCWFVARQEAIAAYFEPYEALRAWMGRMQAFSDTGETQMISGAEAVAIAQAATPAAIERATIDTKSGLEAGAQVQIVPTDYGFQPVDGVLLALDDARISIARDDARAGRVHVHFPRYGFAVSAAGA